MPDAAPIAPLPGDSRQGGHPWIETLVLAIAVAIAFGGAVPDFYQAADDLLATGVMHDIAALHPRLLDRIQAVVASDEGQGHFRPTQDFLYVLLYAAFGPERWIFACMLVYALCHFASGCLLMAILKRLGCNRAVAFVAGLIFALHPVWDENLASVQFGNNVPGLAAILAAALFWLPVSGSRTREALRLAAASVFLFLAIGLGINLMASGAILLGLLTLAIAWQRRSFGTLVARGAFLALTLGLGALHRLLAYGALTTKHPSYQHLERNWIPLNLLLEVPRSAFLLEASPMAWWTSKMNPVGLTWDDGSAALLSLDGAIVLATAAFLCLVVLVLRKHDARQPGTAGSQRLAPGFWFGLALTFAMLFPYYVFVGRAGPHRYLYPTIAGLAVMAATAGAGALRKLASLASERVAVVTGALVLAFILGALLREDREAARSIALGHRVVHAVESKLIEDVRGDPRIKRVYVLGYPRMIGRAGHTIVFPSHMRAVVNAVLDTKLEATDAEFHQDLMIGRLTLPLEPDTAVYLVEPDGVTIRRLPDPADKDLPVYARAEGYAAVGRAWRIDDDREALATLLSKDPTVVEAVVKVLVDLENLNRGFLIKTAFLDSRGSPLLARAAQAVARRDADGRQFMARAAVVTTDPEAGKAIYEVLAEGNPKMNFEGAKKAVELERDAYAMAARGATGAESIKTFQSVQAAWTDVGIARNDLYDSISFSHLLDLSDADLVATQQDWASRGWTRLAEAAAGFRTSRTRATLDDVSIQLIPRGQMVSGTGGPIALEVLVHNESDVYLPGAVSPISARLVWTAVTADGKEVPAGDQWFPAEGIGANSDKNVMVSIADVSTPNLVALRVDLLGYRKKCASATWALPQQHAMADSAGSK